MPDDRYVWSRLRMRHIRLLVAIDQFRNLRRAAEHCAMTQPAATRLLAEIEDVLRVRLFDRTTRGIVPNEFGDSIVRHARQVLATLSHARHELEALSEGATGRISVGTLPVAAGALVPRTILHFKGQHPTVTVLVREGSVGNLLPLLRSGEIDIIVGRASADLDGDDLHFEVFYMEPMVLVCRNGHPLTAQRNLDIATLSRELWLMPTPEAPYRKRLEAAFRQSGGQPPRRIIESLSLSTNKRIVEMSDALAAMPRDIARDYAAAGVLKILPVELPAPSGPVGAVTLANRPLPPAAGEFLQALRETATTAEHPPPVSSARAARVS